MPTISGVNFGRDFFEGGPTPWRNKKKKTLEEFAGKFAGNCSNIRQTKL